MFSCVKYIVIIYNFLFWLAGLVILGASLFVYVDSKAYVNFEATAEHYGTPFFILMVVGVVMTFVGFLGCCGAIKENVCLIVTYIFFLITIGSVCLVAVWWAIQNGQIVRSNIKTEFRKQIKEVYANENSSFCATKFVVDRIQRDFACCGDKGIYDWHNSLFNSNDSSSRHFKNRTLAGINETGISSTGVYQVPQSCCKLTLAPSECEKQRKLIVGIGEMAVGLNRDGCSSKVEQFLEQKWKFFLVIGAGLIGIQILAFTFSCCLCIGIFKKSDDDDLK